MVGMSLNCSTQKLIIDQVIIVYRLHIVLYGTQYEPTVPMPGA